MSITKHFKETVQARALRDRTFREGLLRESVELMLLGDMETGKAVLRDYINATLGFKQLGSITQKSSKSLMRMFSPDGNPTADNLFSIISALRQQEGIRFRVDTLR